MLSIRANPTRSWSRLDGVDCLRALAIFYVLMNHVNMRMLGTGAAYKHLLRDAHSGPWMTALVWQGQKGVQIFFAVSGFLITSTTMRRWGSLSALNIKKFYLLRFARIAPLLFALLAVLSLLHLLHVRHFVVAPESGGLPAALTAALTLRIGLLEATRGYLPGNWDILWSLSVEELFYLIFPVACVLLKRGNSLLVLLGMLVILGPFARTVLTHHNPVWQEYSYLGGMDAIALGCLTAIVLNGRQLSRAVVVASAAAGGALLVFCLCFSAQSAALGLERTGLGMTVTGIGACLLIAAAAQTCWQAPRLLAPLLAYGRRSYEVYLTHMFVVAVLFDWFERHGAPLRLSPLLFAGVIAAAGILGELVARLYSEPANRWLRSGWGDGPAGLESVALDA